MGPNESVFLISFRKSLQKLSSSSKTKTKTVQGEKGALDRLLHGQMKLDVFKEVNKKGFHTSTAFTKTVLPETSLGHCLIFKGYAYPL